VNSALRLCVSIDSGSVVQECVFRYAALVSNFTAGENLVFRMIIAITIFSIKMGFFPLTTTYLPFIKHLE